ncbi:hypothetical protein [Acuticoccus sp.]|uniref:hypothetical protein n=1 Tax=Acuticoccus sp. TaxID=1904378 RepID=UPI003B522A0A
MATAIVGAIASVVGAAAYAPQKAEPERARAAEVGATMGPVRPTEGGKSDLPPAIERRPSPPSNGEAVTPASVPEGEAAEPRPPSEHRAIEPDPGGVGDEDPHAADEEVLATPPPARARLADVSWAAATLPEPVAATRDALLGAARTGDVEALRPLFEGQALPPLVSAMGGVDDPIAFLKRQSGDREGREILAILIELLEAGHVHLEKDGTYVWPYFAEVPLAELEAPHYVELYRILTSIDVEEMERQGRYTFFRVGIGRDGRVRYFAAGDLE